MKRLLFVLLFAMAAWSASASSVHYFTLAQSNRVVRYLNSQDELMIYCAYANELETYVLLNDVWAEPVNSRYYEIWIYGYDAYTGEEIMMPVDLECVWLQRGSRMYNAAEYLRFRCTVPQVNIVWSMPAYNTYVRVSHPAVVTYTYHYEVHRYGWVPPAPHTQTVVNVYYQRKPTDPLPVIVDRYTPGKEAPKVVTDRIQSTTSRPAPVQTARPAPASASSSNSNVAIKNGSTPTTTRPSGNGQPNPPSGNNTPAPKPSKSSSTTSSVSNSKTSTTQRPGTTSSSPTVIKSSNNTTTTSGNTVIKSSTLNAGASSSSVRSTSTTRPASTSSTTSSTAKASKSGTTTTSKTASSTTRTPTTKASGTSSSSTRTTSSSRPTSTSSRPTSTTSRPK